MLFKRKKKTDATPKPDLILSVPYSESFRGFKRVKLDSQDKYLPLAYREATVLDYIDGNCLLFVGESSSVRERVQNCTKLQNEEIKAMLEEGKLCAGLDKFYLTLPELLREYEKKKVIYLDNFARGSFDVPVKELINFKANTLPAWNGRFDILLEDIGSLVKNKAQIIILGGTDKNAKSLADDLVNISPFAVILIHLIHVNVGGDGLSISRKRDACPDLIVHLGDFPDLDMRVRVRRRKELLDVIPDILCKFSLIQHLCSPFRRVHPLLCNFLRPFGISRKTLFHLFHFFLPSVFFFVHICSFPENEEPKGPLTFSMLTPASSWPQR